MYGRKALLSGRYIRVDAVVQETPSDPSNMTVVGDVEAWTRLETELPTCSATCSLSCSRTRSTGRIKIRTIPFDEVLSIIANPDDAGHYSGLESSTIPRDQQHKAYYGEIPRRRTSRYRYSQSSSPVYIVPTAERYAEMRSTLMGEHVPKSG